MGVKMEIECGTWKPAKFEIDLDDYGQSNMVQQGPNYKKAYDLLRSTLNDVTFADDGCRNEDAVNSLIALYVLGYDAKEWMECFLNDMDSRSWLFHSIDIDKFREHVERVVPYLDSWGPEGDRAHALVFAIQ